MSGRTQQWATAWTRRRWLPGEGRMSTGAVTEAIAVAHPDAAPGDHTTTVLTPTTRTPKRGKETEQ
ncbi:hypothetical protein SAMN04487820_110187 [Actinopolyspora mzabensis]|uniref:Uncharacterized protein n=1 Tax=Actinopolyspora mzabensis TaxID=995066 RepID=A0A1G9DMG7_ACTMZ|nr:hypothetical protein [Actinopolyspora mzabensis]SDK65096.1 hypothetical protein SAMN04487820_110187 [Actinopolyspora mzabensis]